MARYRFSDILMTNRFHVLDVSLSFPPVLIPIFGFQNCTSPELTIQYREIKEGNYEYPRKVVERASVSVMTFENGSQLLNSDFYDWISKAPDGRTVKKNLMVIHFTNIDPRSINFDGSEKKFENTAGQSSLGGLVEFDFRLPAKAWLLKNCVPARYKGGMDFDAMSTQPSLQQLDIEYEEFMEFNTGIS